jgi:hypothetical protein
MYPEFSDAKYYKAICYAKLGKKQEEIKDYLKRLKLITKQDIQLMKIMPLYETYPYQKKWRE